MSEVAGHFAQGLTGVRPVREQQTADDKADGGSGGAMSTAVEEAPKASAAAPQRSGERKLSLPSFRPDTSAPGSRNERKSYPSGLPGQFSSLVGEVRDLRIVVTLQESPRPAQTVHAARRPAPKPRVQRPEVDRIAGAFSKALYWCAARPWPHPCFAEPIMYCNIPRRRNNASASAQTSCASRPGRCVTRREKDMGSADPRPLAVWKSNFKAVMLSCNCVCSTA